jgi:NAD(P)-dependent dehydrogenase (short-subunit alcohol dehydrogenase family)
MNLKNSVAFVTGGNRGLGLAFAREVLSRGAAKVYAGVRDPGGFHDPDIVPVRADVTDPASVLAAAARCRDTTLLVNNAGIANVAFPLDWEMEDRSREFFETNYYGLVRASQAFAPVLAENGGGAIINVLSDTVWRPIPMLAAYGASKAAAWSFTNTLRIQLQDQGTRVLALHVGYVDTDMTRGLNVAKSNPEEVIRQALDALEAGKAEVLADAGTRELKADLASECAQYLRG